MAMGAKVFPSSIASSSITILITRNDFHYKIKMVQVSKIDDEKGVVQNLPSMLNIYLNGHHIWFIQKLWMIYSWSYIIFHISIVIMILIILLIFNIDFDTDIDIDDQGRL